MAGSEAAKSLVLGIGNVLLSDDGIGVHVIRALAAHCDDTTVLRDGGTIGLELLSEIEQFQTVVVVDAMDLGAAPGTVGAFIGSDMDCQLQGTKRSVHEVALADVMNAARLLGSLPPRRALIGIQPASTQSGLELTPPVEAAIGPACESVQRLIEEWNHAA